MYISILRKCARLDHQTGRFRFGLHLMAKLKALDSRLSALPSRVAWLDQDKAAASRARDAIRVDRAFYKTARWQRLRWSILERDLFTCRRCGAVEADSSKLVADHIIPAVERPELIWDAANLQCLCVGCHSGAKQREERGVGRSLGRFGL